MLDCDLPDADAAAITCWRDECCAAALTLELFAAPRWPATCWRFMTVDGEMSRRARCHGGGVLWKCMRRRGRHRWLHWSEGAALRFPPIAGQWLPHSTLRHRQHSLPQGMLHPQQRSDLVRLNTTVYAAGGRPTPLLQFDTLVPFLRLLQL